MSVRLRRQQCSPDVQTAVFTLDSLHNRVEELLSYSSVKCGEEMMEQTPQVLANIVNTSSAPALTQT